ncbi:hypothetical protein EYF80_053047 [Liparis tanakae]|uniref:Uncharacterized protein n=1 Tax=Liparis tanakae TaxID=230148 RepID=A0A4Z2F6W0_9TELE|nr:hypothetical protein EYF80_053047 [Liparis tanakae]
MAGEIKEGVAHGEAGLLGNRVSYLTNQEHGDLAAPDVSALHGTLQPEHPSNAPRIQALTGWNSPRKHEAAPRVLLRKTLPLKPDYFDSYSTYKLISRSHSPAFRTSGSRPRSWDPDKVAGRIRADLPTCVGRSLLALLW